MENKYDSRTGHELRPEGDVAAAERQADARGPTTAELGQTLGSAALSCLKCCVWRGFAWLRLSMNDSSLILAEVMFLIGGT